MITNYDRVYLMCLESFKEKLEKEMLIVPS